jgi:hypothetical protein
LPWQEGVRLVNPVALDEYQEAMTNAESAYWQAVDDFIAQLPRMKVEYMDHLIDHGLSEFYNEADYVGLSRDSFGFDVSLQPLPHDTQFDQVANIIGAEKAQELADELIDRQSQQWESATRDVWERLHKTLQRASDKLNHGQRLHDSVMDNLQDLTDLLPVLNITKLPGI